MTAALTWQPRYSQGCRITTLPGDGGILALTVDSGVGAKGYKLVSGSARWFPSISLVAVLPLSLGEHCSSLIICILLLRII